MQDRINSSPVNLNAEYLRLKHITSVESELAVRGVVPEPERYRVQCSDEQFARLLGRGTAVNADVTVQEVTD